MDLREGASGVEPAGHWYYRTKKRPLLAYFKALPRGDAPLGVVDIGAGSGFFSECMIEVGGGRLGDVTLVDSAYPANEASSDARIRGELKRVRSLPAEIRGSLLVLMDVLEHVEDDAAFLSDVVARCRGRNHVFITVPAFQSLWSSHDEFLHHHRRYELGPLKRLAAGAGVEITSAYYLYGLIFPFVWLVRRLKPGSRAPNSDLEPASALVSFFLERVCGLEFPFRRWNRFFGVTCVLEGVIAPGP
jgi:hypothetical protein